MATPVAERPWYKSPLKVGLLLVTLIIAALFLSQRGAFDFWKTSEVAPASVAAAEKQPQTKPAERINAADVEVEVLHAQLTELRNENVEINKKLDVLVKCACKQPRQPLKGNAKSAPKEVGQPKQDRSIGQVKKETDVERFIRTHRQPEVKCVPNPNMSTQQGVCK